MMKKLLTFLAAILCAASMWADVAVNGKLPGAFSVAADKVVYFSQGNLQYKASTGTWRFATNQYDYVGDASLGNVYENEVKCNNLLISSTYTGWVDLFAWATSGWDNTANEPTSVYYEPWRATNGEGGKYGPNVSNIGEYQSWMKSSEFENYDWGVYNAGQLGNGWYTMSTTEWNYLLSSRSNASSLRATATVNDVFGVILLPDDYVMPDGLSMTYTLYSTTANVYDLSQWTALEEAGAVFIPAAGGRYNGTQMSSVGVACCYWTSCAYHRFYNEQACWLYINPNQYWTASNNNGRQTGYAVRLVSEIAPVQIQNLTANQDPNHTSDYYSTFYDSSNKYTLPAGVEAYVAELSGDALNLTKIAEGGQVIPMNNAVILKANSGSITLTPSDAVAVTFTATNNLHGVDAATAAPANCYVLSGHSSDNSVTGVGFYQYTGTLKAHKAYAVISGGVAYAPKKLRFVFNQEQTTTDITNVQSDNVQCTKVIRNGQLIIIRGDKEYNVDGQIVK